MRSLLPLSILLAATAACTQPLTPDMTGTGGTGGTGGSGGSVSSVCNTLVAEYGRAVSAAQTCQVGASGQCQQLVPAALTSCSCATYVADSSTLSAIEDSWTAAGCTVAGPVCDLFCPAAVNTTCVATAGGSTGVCSYVPGTGGTSGTDGTGGRGAGGSRDGGTSGGKDGAVGTPGLPAAVIYPSSANAGAYMLELSNAPLDCKNTTPTFACSPADVTYWVQIQMPPKDLTPGVYPLSSLIYPSFSETGPNSDIPSSCWGGGGSFGEGTLEIVSVSSTDMVFRLHDTLILDFNVNDSTFIAALCAGVTGAVPPVDSVAL